MSFDALLVHTVTVVAAAEQTDRYGDEQPDWGDTTGVETPGRVVRRTETEILDGRTADITEWVVFLPGDIAVDIADRVEWDGMTFEVVGDAEPAIRRTATVHHLEVPLKRVEG